MKWGLVAAGLKDLARPADKLSVSQNVGEFLIRFLIRFLANKIAVLTVVRNQPLLARDSFGFGTLSSSSQ